MNLQDKKRIISENLIGFLPLGYEHFASHNLFSDLVDAYIELSESENPSFKKLRFLHSLDNFYHLCENHPEQKVIKEKNIEKEEMEKKELKLKQLYQKHLSR